MAQNAGLEISRSMLSKLVLTPSQDGVNNPDNPCTSRVLAAPVLDSRDVRPFGDPARIEQAGDARKKLRFRPGPFDDAVVFHTGEIKTTTFYLFVDRELLASRMVVVAATDETDNVFQQIVLDGSLMMPPQVFPGSWTDASGPWFDETFHVAQHQAALQRRGYIGVLVTIKGHEDADRLQIGLLPQESEWHRKHMKRPFYVAAMEVLTSAEFFRSDYDTEEQTKKQGVLEAALSDSSSGQALLKPDTAYAVRVVYDASAVNVRQDQRSRTSIPRPNLHQTFWFYTDNEPPRRLDPWMMCSTPEDGEHHYFGELPIHIVFNSPDVGRIYEAYGKRLQVQLRAASFRPLPSTPSVPHPFPLTPANLKPVPASVLSPWEAIAVEQLTDSCVPISGTRVRHTMTTLPIPLEPFTDYVLDIQMVDTGAPENAVGTVVWRIGFSTGRFATIDKFAQSFQLERVLHRFSKPNLVQAIGAQPWAVNPQGNQLDVAMTGAGLEPMGVPEAPRVVVFWETTGPDPQPAAVLVDASEPMWRSRQIPEEIVDPNPPHASRYELTSVEWLKLEQEAGGDAIVDKIIKAARRPASTDHAETQFAREAVTAGVATPANEGKIFGWTISHGSFLHHRGHQAQRCALGGARLMAFIVDTSKFQAERRLPAVASGCPPAGVEHRADAAGRAAITLDVERRTWFPDRALHRLAAQSQEQSAENNQPGSPFVGVVRPELRT